MCVSARGGLLFFPCRGILVCHRILFERREWERYASAGAESGKQMRQLNAILVVLGRLTRWKMRLDGEAPSEEIACSSKKGFCWRTSLRAVYFGVGLRRTGGLKLKKDAFAIQQGVRTQGSQLRLLDSVPIATGLWWNGELVKSALSYLRANPKIDVGYHGIVQWISCTPLPPPKKAFCIGVADNLDVSRTLRGKKEA